MRNKSICVFLGALSLAACQPGIPKEALQLSPQSLQQRQLQTRRFETLDEAKLLSASAAVLQDLGFALDNSETEVGLVVASKDRDATEAGQIAAAIAVAVLTGAYVPTDKNQKIRASLVTKPVDDGKSTNVRVTFQRTVWNTQGNVTRIEGLKDPELYQKFFNSLSQSVFLQANEI
jgi:hypothetical protein